METVIDIMYFINDLYFVGILGDDYKKFDCVRKILVSEFKDHDSEKLTNMLGFLDDLYISFRRWEFSHIVDKVRLLREDIFQLVKEKILITEEYSCLLSYKRL